MCGWRQDGDLGVADGRAQTVFQRQREFAVVFAGRRLNDEFDHRVGHRAIDDFPIVNQNFLADAPGSLRFFHALNECW